MKLLAEKFLCLMMVCLFVTVIQSAAQTSTGNQSTENIIQYDSQGRPVRPTKGGDSLQHRDRYADSITIYYRYFDSTRTRKIDSSINDFSKRFPQPYTYVTLGNFGTASHSLLFNPLMKAGWDEGFHQFDLYNYTVENTRFFQTTRPYTELAYALGNNSEQLVDILHTQNKKSNFNFSFEYRFSNAPGQLRTDNANLNNMRFTWRYQTMNKRYEAYFIFLNNKNVSSENGGLKDVKYIDSIQLSDPYQLETRLGNAGPASRNPFTNTTITTGNIYKENIFLYRQHYDLGQKDSIVTDSVTIKLFYPRLRLEHTLTINTSSYNFFDYYADSTAYKTYFNYNLPGNATSYYDTVSFKDAWTNIINEFSLISYPDKHNLSQFAKVGAGLQNLKATFNDSITDSYYNLYVLGEYRNRTRNNIWDVEANGKIYLNGFNAGDYSAFISLKRQLSKKIGFLQLGVQNVNRTPSFIFNAKTSFPVQLHSSFNKENIIRLFANYENPKAAFKLSGEYFLVNNYTYFDSFFTAKQYAPLYNVLHVSAEKVFKLSKYFNWYTEIHLQQATGGAPVSLPFLLTRNRIAFEGNFYTNLFLSTGLEFRYYSNYTADNYSPFTGQFFYQNSFTTSNKPDVNFFFHFRIKSFKGFLRFENLNTLLGTGKDKYNYTAPLYQSQTVWLRFGVWWSFVN